MADRRSPAIAVGAVLGLVVLLGCVVAIGAAAGPTDVVTGKGHRLEHHVTRPIATPGQSPRSQGPSKHRHREPPDWLGWVVVAAVVGAAALVGYAVWAAAPRMGWRMPRTAGPPDIPDEPATDPRVVADRLHTTAGERLAALETGDPRNAIVDCWQRLERLFEEAGAARAPWETSTEFTARVLREVRADPDGVRRLAALYREARFSEHPIVEDQRAQARVALAAVHASLVAEPWAGR